MTCYINLDFRGFKEVVYPLSQLGSTPCHYPAHATYQYLYLLFGDPPSSVDVIRRSSLTANSYQLSRKRALEEPEMLL